MEISIRGSNPAFAACERNSAADPSLSSTQVSEAKDLSGRGSIDPHAGWSTPTRTRISSVPALFSGHPAPDEASRRRRIDHVSVHGSIATASMTLHHGADTFTDLFLLIEVGGVWQIANKLYHRETLAGPAAA